jgi:chromosome segregation ATPase
MVEQLTSELR